MKSERMIQVAAPTFYVNKKDPRIVIYGHPEHLEDWIYTGVGSEPAKSPAPMKEDDWLYFYNDYIVILNMAKKRNRRIQIDQEALDTSIQEIADKTDYRINQKGRGAWQSTHEVLGVITEEYWELQEAIKNNNLEQVKKELMDIAVACHFGITCINEQTLDW